MGGADQSAVMVWPPRQGFALAQAVLKRGFYGVYHSFSAKHVQRYVSEFAFRLNDGNVRIHTMERVDTLLSMTVGKRITYRDLVEA